MIINFPKINELSVLNHLRPISKAIPYIREEREGYWSLLTNNGDANYSMLNITGHMVLTLCDGRNTPLDILSELSIKYPEVSRKKIESDLIKILISLTQTNAIEWRNEQNMSKNPFQITASSNWHGDITFALVMEHEIRDLSEFLSNAVNSVGCNKSVYVWGENYSEHTDPLVIRQCLYSYYKDFFVLKRDGIIIGAIIVHPAVEMFINEAEIQLIALPEGSITSVMREVITYYAQFPYKKTNLLQICLPKTFVQENADFVTALSNAGFMQEAIRKQAYLNDDLYIYVCEINNEAKKLSGEVLE